MRIQMTFLDRILPDVQKAKQETGSHLLVSVALAQVILESDYGKSELAVKANNYAGHKYDPQLHKEWYSKVSSEWNGKAMIKVESKFAKYPNFTAFIKQHFNWFNSTPYREKTYAELFQATTAEEQAKALTGTYATDPNYADKLMRLINQYHLTQYDKGSDKMTYPKPNIIDRRKRALGYPDRGIYPWRDLKSITTLVWHYSATVRQGTTEQVIKGHESYWRNHHGWEIGGYHYFIGRDGTIVQNYDLTLGTYGAGQANPYTVHICCEASNKNNYTEAQKKSREALTLWLMTRSDLPNLKTLLGHKEVPGNSTTCPGYSKAELDNYRKDIYAKIKKSNNNTTSTMNPQGLKTRPIPKYKGTSIPFKRFKVGDTITIRNPFNWIDTENHLYMQSKRHDELVGTKDKIVEVKQYQAEYSNYIYKLEKYNSWIAEQDIVEARESGKKTDKQTDAGVEVKDNYLYFDGVKYKLVEDK